MCLQRKWMRRLPVIHVKRVQTSRCTRGTLSEMVVSCVVASDGSALEEAAIIAHLKTTLASYKIHAGFCSSRE